MTDTATKILAFLRSQQLAVIATSHPERPTPESALIAVVSDDHLCLYFQTGSDTRKAANLQRNPHVSLVIGLSKEGKMTVQYEGVAEQLHDPADIAACKRRFLDSNSPTTEKHMSRPSAIFFVVKPVWIGCSDYRGARPVVTELTF